MEIGKRILNGNTEAMIRQKMLQLLGAVVAEHWRKNSELNLAHSREKALEGFMLGNKIF